MVTATPGEGPNQIIEPPDRCVGLALGKFARNNVKVVKINSVSDSPESGRHSRSEILKLARR